MLPFEFDPILLRRHYYSFAFCNDNAILMKKPCRFYPAA